MTGLIEVNRFFSHNLREMNLSQSTYCATTRELVDFAFAFWDSGSLVRSFTGPIYAGEREEERERAEERRRPPEGFVRIAAGTFTMGSPAGESGHDNDEGQHRVTITRDFFMQTHELTQGECRALMGNNPSQFSSCGNSCPVEMVNWCEALAYANARSRAEGLDQCYTLSGCTNDPGRDMAL